MMRKLALIPVYAALIFVCLLFIFPFYWVVNSSLMSIKGLDLKPPALYPAVERTMNASAPAAGHVFEAGGQMWMPLAKSPDLTQPGGPGLYCLLLRQDGPKAPLTPSLMAQWFSEADWKAKAKPYQGSQKTIAFKDLPVSAINGVARGIVTKQVLGNGATLHEVWFTIPALAAGSKGTFSMSGAQPVLDPQTHRLLIFHAQLSNYAATLKGPEATIGGQSSGFLLFMKNSLFLAIVAVLGQLLSSSLTAYAFARLRFKGRDTLFIILLATMMIPSQVTLIPLFFVYRSLHWVDTFLPLIVPSLTAGAFNVFLIRQFLLTFPKELDESAVMDGASHWRIYKDVILPNCGPVLIVVGLFTFVASWQDIFGPLIYLDNPAYRTVTLGLEYFRSPYVDNRPLLMAGAVLSIIPVFILFLFAQRHILAGIATTGLKD